MPSLPPSWVRWPYARIRRELSVDEGMVTRFVFQLEYDIRATPTGENTPEWRPVARFDHDVDGQQSHDVRDEGLHLDLYRDGEKYEVLTNFPPVSLPRTPRYAQEYLERHADRLLQQFEEWHDLHGPWRHDSSP